jgi:chemosensory pili system protein ChpA (sensor histidine kinase/response regulator)
MDAEQRKKITGYFILEAQEHLEIMDASLQNFQATIDDPEQIHEIYRGAHSIKGGAAMLELESIRFTAHRLEDYFKHLKNHPATVDQGLRDDIHQLYSILLESIETLEASLEIDPDYAQGMLDRVQPLCDRIGPHLKALTEDQGMGGVTLPDEIITALNALTVLAKQPDDAANRVQIQHHCQTLQELGQAWPNSGWNRVIEAAQGAIAIPHNPYTPTSQQILADLQHNAPLLVQGQTNLRPSEALHTLAHAAPAPPLDDLADFAALGDDPGQAPEDDLDFADFLGDDLREPTPQPAARADRDDLEALLNEFDTTPPIEGEELDNLLSSFDTYSSRPEPSVSAAQETHLSEELDDLFGDESALTNEDLGVTATPSMDHRFTQDDDLLAIGHTAAAPSPAAGSESVGDLFGTDFSFEMETDAAAIADIPTQPSHTGAIASGEVHTELDQDLDDLFADIEDGDTHGLFAHHGEGGLISSVLAPESPSPLPDSGDEFRDLLAIGEDSSPEAMFSDEPETLNSFEIDPFGALGGTADTGNGTPQTAVPSSESLDSLFDDPSFLSEEDASDDDLAAFLSGEDTTMAIGLDADELDELDSLIGEEGEPLTAADMDELGAFLSGEGDAQDAFSPITPMQAAATDESADVAASFDDLFGDLDATPAGDTVDHADFDALFEMTAAAAGDRTEIDDLEALLSGAPDTTDAELEDLFDDAAPIAPESLNIDEFEELEALLESSAAPEAAADDAAVADVDALEALFAAESAQPAQPAAPPRPASPPPAATPPATTSAEGPCYYDQLDELMARVERSPLDEAKHLTLATSFTALEQLLDQRPHPPLQPVNGASPAPSAAPANGNNPAADDGDWDDLINIMQETRQKAGEISSVQRPAAKPRSKPTVEATLKVPVKQMDNLNNLVGELVVNRNSLEGDEERLRQFLDNLMHQVQNLNDVGGRMQDLYERSLLEDALLRSRREYRSKQGGGDFSPILPNGQTQPETKSEFDELEMDSFTKFHELAQETIEMIVRVRESTADIQFLVDDIDQVARTLRQVTSQLQEGLNKSRMIPFGTTASRLPLAVRRIAPQLNKQANLELEGQETLIDKMLLEHLSDPLTHLVNNALTHGIEPPEIRLASGKPQAGHIKVSAMQQGNQTVIAVSDDGAGIDAVRVRQKAIDKGVITAAQAAQMDEQSTFELLFNAGFSTKDQADNFAGRGVGLDVVLTSIHEIRGTVTIDSKLNKGTTFTIRLPLTLSIGKALCCVSENAPIAFPLDGVEDMIDLPHHKIRRNAQGQPCVQYRDMLLPYYHLSSLLTYTRRIGRGSFYGNKREDNILPVVLLRGADHHIAVGVDQVIGEQEIVIKQLQGPVPKPAGIAGATVRGDGTIMAIADVLELIELAQGRLRKETANTWQTMNNLPEEQGSIVRSEPTVLIVDDSITVRELLSMTFGKAGYRVEQARDGQDAWDKLRSGLPCDIIFCDIEMPRIDGLDLLERLSQDEELRQIPIAMLTSRGAERHRKVAAERGASGYFTKPYLEDVLLDAAERMIQGDVLLEGSIRTQWAAKPKAPPTPTPDPVVTAPIAAQPEQQAQVLIIDDSVTVRSLLSMTFEKAGYEVEQARDGKEAWEQLKGGLRPDLIFCDIEMPRMDGLELLGTIYEDADLQRIPVAMLTSRGAERHRKVAAERGASGYFTKPYVEQDLLAAADRIRRGEILLKDSVRAPDLTTHAQAAPAAHAPAPEPVADQDLPLDDRSTIIQDFEFEDAPTQISPADAAPPPTPPSPAAQRSHQAQPLRHQPRVLIIDDSITVRSLLSMTFEKAGYEVEQARDGKDALEKLQGGLNPDLAFCDIEMPKMDGLTLLSHVSEDEALKQIPIAMLTSRGAKKHQLAAAERGAKGYFTKPYTEEVLLDAARRLMEGEVLLKVEA